MAEEQLDPSLADLLDEIEQAEGSAKAASEEPKDTTPKVEPTEEASEDFKEELEVNDTPEAGDYADEDDEEVETIADVVVEAEASPMEDELQTEHHKLQKNVLNMLQKHCDSAESMIDEAESDRKKIDDILGLVLPKIEGDDYRSADITTVAQLMQIKADISRNRASTMDSISKLFVALKGNDTIGVKAKAETGVSQEEVTKLLSKRED